MFDYSRAYAQMQRTAHDLHGKAAKVHETTFRAVVDGYVNEIRAKGESKGRTADGLRKEAVERILAWYMTGHEYSVTPYDSCFAGNYFRACVWAVFLRKEHMALEA